MNMKTIGYLLLTAGVLGGSLISVLEVLEVNWINFIGAVVVALVGIIIVRREISKESTSEGKIAGNIQDIAESLDKIVDELAVINTGNTDEGPEDPYKVHGQLDVNLPGYFDKFVEARGSLGHVYGLQVYADIMNSFAAGERYVNRVWSASADGYIDESREYLNRAQEQFLEAQQKFKALKS
ncbi:MAG: hypothetical protein DWQ05_09665 [Calditrichaeota bacterium]|nr:MAG: hypothetical protein DWQ05_09665 [Calditrichota bacterium]